MFTVVHDDTFIKNGELPAPIMRTEAWLNCSDAARASSIRKIKEYLNIDNEPSFPPLFDRCEKYYRMAWSTLLCEKEHPGKDTEHIRYHMIIVINDLGPAIKSLYLLRLDEREFVKTGIVDIYDCPRVQVLTSDGVWKWLPVAMFDHRLIKQEFHELNLTDLKSILLCGE